jgi:hypothetical protein
MDDGYLSERRQEILDGKRVWEAKEFGDDFDRILAEVVHPLRLLRLRGAFEKVFEQTTAINGDIQIFAVEIAGAIDYDTL